MIWSLGEILAFIETHHVWGAVLFGLLAFGESLVIVGVLIPGTVVLLAMGPLVGSGHLPFWEILIGGAIGGLMGDIVSYWMGRTLYEPMKTSPWVASHLGLLTRAEAVFQRWGWAALFIGRFIGPLRASVPFVAGMLRMQHMAFLAVSAVSALVWVPVLVAPGAFVTWSADLWGDGRMREAVSVFAVVLVLVVVGGLAAWRSRSQST
jgi:membrane protein DedA with SNARE-associated domain